jgi:hypothetical protein
MDQMEIERRKRLAAQMVHPFAPGQQMQTIPSAAAQYGPGILKSLAGVPTDEEGAEMDALSGQFQTGLSEGNRRKMAEALGGQAGVLAPYMAGAGVIKAYHGSPHSFDKFRMDRIGTGEGAQAYGHGLYFAENEGVARSYRDGLQIGVDYQGKGYPGGDTNSAAKFVADRIDVENPNILGSIASAAKEFRNQSRYLKSKLNNGPMATREANERLANSYDDLAAQVESLNPDDFKITPGSMYEVNINANPEDFLDWDVRLSEQPESVRRAFEGFPEDMRGGNAVRAHELFVGDKAKLDNDILQHAPGAWAKEGTRILRDKGIPGIKYLDGNSRSVGEGSRNYVVFDENLISIVKKYGIAGAVAAGLLTNEQAQAFQNEALAERLMPYMQQGQGNGNPRLGP